MKEIVLASQSPRRKELLSVITPDFVVDPSSVDENFDTNLTPPEVVEYLSKIKAEEVAKRHPNKIVIGSDTIVVCHNTILGKPVDDHDAFQMLKYLSGQAHNVITGVTIIKNENREVFHSTTKVEFFELTDDEIWSYIKTKEPFDKAGAYGIQGNAAKFIKSIEGDYFTVVGLPIAELYQRLKNY